MTQTADAAGVRGARRATAASALFVLVREERGSTDIRFIGGFSGAALHPFPDVLRQAMRRRPAFIHLDLREVSAIDSEGIKHLVHAARICRCHGAMVKISVSSAVERAVESGEIGPALGILSRDAREGLSASDEEASPNGSRGGPRY